MDQFYEDFEEELSKKARERMMDWLDKSMLKSMQKIRFIHQRIPEFFFEYKEASNNQIIEKANAELIKNTEFSKS